MMPLRFHLSPPEVHPQQCVNARHRQAGCRLCVDHCPTDAIQLAPGPLPLPLLDPQVCVGCGACLPVCPTDAFGQSMAPEARLVGFRDELPAGGTLALACPQHPAPSQTSAPVDYVIQHERCLAGFSVDQLLDLSDEGARAIWLDDGPCETCPLAPAQADIAQRAEAINQLLAAFGIPPAVHRVSAQPDPQPPAAPLPVLQGTAPAVDRRGFFRSLGRLAQQRLEEAEARDHRPMLDPGAPVDQRLPYRIPASLKRLDGHLMALAQASEPVSGFLLDAEALPWSDLDVRVDACSGCQLCARFCPTGALNYLWGELEEGIAFNLNFHPRLCLDCHICVAVCPEDALDLTGSVTVDLLLQPERTLLVADYLVPCERCGTLTRPRPGDEEVLCFVCRGPTMYRQRTQRSYLQNLAQQLAEHQKQTQEKN